MKARREQRDSLERRESARDGGAMGDLARRSGEWALAQDPLHDPSHDPSHDSPRDPESGAWRAHERVHLAQRVARVAGVDVRYLVTGHGDPVVLVHGLSGSSRWWARNIPALAERYTVYLVDLPGFGALRRFPQHLALPELGAWLLGWMDAVGLERIRLVGHSMGGALAIQVATQRPEAIERLVLAAPAAIPSGRQTVRSYLLPLVAALPATTPGFLPILAYDALRAGPRTLLRFTRDLLTQDAREELRRVTVPTLLIWGQRDTLVPPSLGEQMRQALPHAELVILEGAGHVVMYDRPAAFNVATLRFFAGPV